MMISQKKYALLSLVFAVVTAILVVFYLNSIGSKEKQLLRSKLNSFENLSTVVVAKADISPGTIISRNNVKVVKMLSAYVSKSSVADLNSILGKRAKSSIYAGEQISFHRVKEEAKSLSSEIKENHLALAIGIDEVSGVGREIKAGDKVDVFVVYENSSKAKLLLKAIPILNVVGQGVYGSAENPKGFLKARSDFSSVISSVVVQVTESQAAKLSYASEKGRIRLALLPLGEN